MLGCPVTTACELRLPDDHTYRTPVDFNTPSFQHLICFYIVPVLEVPVKLDFK
jgi:hypothetical protein